MNAIRRTFALMTTRQKVVYAFLTGLRGVTGVLDVFGIMLIGLLSGIAASSLVGGKPLTILGLTFEASPSVLVFLFIAMFGVFLLKAILAIVLGKVVAIYIARVESEKAHEIANHMFHGSLSDISRLTRGEVMWAVMGSTSAAFSGLLMSFTTFVAEGMLLVLVVVTFALIDPVATGIVVLYFTLVILCIQLLVSKSMARAGRDMAEGSAKSADAINDVLSSFREVSVFRRQPYFLDVFSEGRVRLAKSNANLMFLSGMPRYVVETSLMLGVVTFVVWQFATGQLVSGLVTIGVFITGGVRIMGSLLPLQYALANVKTQAEQAELAQSVLAGQSVPMDSIPPTALADSGSIGEVVEESGFSVSVEDVHFRYPSADEDALRKVSLKVSPGEKVAIIGPSGSGKTTLVDLMLGLFSPTRGQVRIAGLEPRELITSAPGTVSYVPQAPGLVSGSIAENIAIGRAADEIDFDRVNEVIDLAYMRDFIDSLPEGMHSSVGKQAEALSGGQIQRLGLARALYQRPRLLILDEATSALDAGSEAFVTESLRQLGQDVTVVIIAHRLSTVQHVDNVIVMENGGIIASGAFADVRRDVPMVAEYVRLMSFDDE